MKEKSTANTVRTDLAIDDKTAADLYVELNGGNLKAAAEILTRALAPSMSIRKARDTFTSVLRSVRNGKIQLVGSDPGEQVIMITARELVAVIARLINAPSFMDALRSEPGYNPPKRKRVFKERPRSRERIRPRALALAKRQPADS
jgi:hypothetical protein